MEIMELTVEVERSDCLVTSHVYSEMVNATVGRLAIGRESCLEKIESDSLLEYITGLRKTAKSVRQVTRTMAWVETESCKACRYFASLGMPVLGSKTVDRSRLVFRLQIQSKKTADRLLREMKDIGLKPRVIEMAPGDGMLITDREREVLLYALKEGYFETNRESSLTELAEGMEVSASSLSNVLRRAVRKLIKEYLKSSV